MMRIPRLQHSFGRKSKRVYSRRAVNDPRRIRFKKSVSSMIMRNLRLLLSFAGVHSLLHTEDPWKKLRENSTRIFGMETSFRKLKMLRMGHRISRAIEDSWLFSKPMAHKFFKKCVTTKFKMFPAPDQCIYISSTLYQRFSCTHFTCADWNANLYCRNCQYGGILPLMYFGVDLAARCGILWQLSILKVSLLSRPFLCHSTETRIGSWYEK